jgi:hypothetical protein
MKVDTEAGVRNLLLNCAGAHSGDRLLLVGEQDPAPYFDPMLCSDVENVALSLDLKVETIFANVASNASQFPQAVSDAMQTADITIFFSRLGDQVRFIESPGNSKKIMTYTVSREHLGSPFASIDYNLMKRMHDQLLDDIKASKKYVIEAENGTHLTAEIPQGSEFGEPVVVKFSVELFPVMIFPPINFSHLEGELVLDHFLLSSSTRAYTDSELHLDSPVTALVEDSRMVEFSGDGQLIEKLCNQLERAAALTGGDPRRLNSWHTGINSYTFFNGDPYRDLEHWGTVAYGSPRYTHIHAAGHDPGDISIQLFDVSISFDDKVYWDHGRFVYLDRPELRERFGKLAQILPDSSIRMSIGL